MGEWCGIDSRHRPTASHSFTLHRLNEHLPTRHQRCRESVPHHHRHGDKTECLVPGDGDQRQRVTVRREQQRLDGLGGLNQAEGSPGGVHADIVYGVPVVRYRDI